MSCYNLSILDNFILPYLRGSSQFPHYSLDVASLKPMVAFHQDQRKIQLLCCFDFFHPSPSEMEMKKKYKKKRKYCIYPQLKHQ